MTLFIFKYALPALLGYTLFFAIAGKLNPLRKPEYLEQRPSWMLGLWTGSSVFLVLSISLHMAYGMTLEAARSLAAPSAIGITLMLGIGFIAYFRYRRKIFENLAEDKPQTEAEMEPLVNWSEKVSQLDLVLEDFPPVLTAPVESNDLSSLQNELEKEKQIRQETERHLRITRKALASKEIIEQTAPAERKSELSAPQTERGFLNFGALNTEEPSQHNELKLNVSNLKRELVKAKHEVRLHVAARAKALSTANKSVAFARQSIELRARLEAELNAAHTELASWQSTIASLVNRLERDRRLTDEELAALAKHVAVYDPVTSPHPTEPVIPSTLAQKNARYASGS